MENSNSDKQTGSMWIFAATGVKLISANTAVEIAKMVTLDRHGQAKLDSSLPLTVAPDGNTWVVTGTYHKEFEERNPGQAPYLGPLRMVISSFDGQILDYTFLPPLPWLKPEAYQNQG